ncbi:hypothetical protein TrLO_g934 [Triparma laevis f. longispina]|uniref:Uncharacterized protein n=1 Tax=Triparma laevis f. longispina TaxID=1714387 RepID=A0A9W7KW28_9STRA|nr:hypothetical protein TrLO_g934 [Triparma laevis f. longispina]
MNSEFGNAEFSNNGWILTGDARVSSKTAWNLLGGYMQFTMDVSNTADGVNTNFYTSSPGKENLGASTYCDDQGDGEQGCMEMDIIENNGKCAMQTTVHTFQTDGQPNNGDCDRWGCAASMPLPDSHVFEIKAMFNEDGSMDVFLDGALHTGYSLYPVPSDNSNSVVVSTMNSIGAVIESSQWFGWAPESDSCPSGSSGGLSSSVLKISDVQVFGKVVQGPTPTLCSELMLDPTPGLRGVAKR